MKPPPPLWGRIEVEGISFHTPTHTLTRRGGGEICWKQK